VTVPTTGDAPPRIGISRCLLGEEVRYDGGHKRDHFLVHTVGPFVEWVPVCPEVEVGMGTPREAIRLVAHDEGVPAGAARVRLVGLRTGADWTRRMADYAARRVRELQPLDLDGYVLKKDSPSCGLTRVRVHASGSATRTGRGLFAQALVDRLPHLPVEDEGRLNDPVLREGFVERVFGYRRLRRFFGARWTLGGLVQFHTAHKLQLLSHSRPLYTELGRLVATGRALPRGELASRYRDAFMRALARPATRGRHADVMMHVLGHVRRRLDDGDRAEMLGVIDDHRRGLVPLVVPITLIRHHVRRHQIEYLADQTYLDPHPRELALRNHV
jgi:uncharacterized protein YbgA (DUF1722 family)/uncharacterized protein YbbK (DUF523 family)